MTGRWDGGAIVAVAVVWHALHNPRQVTFRHFNILDVFEIVVERRVPRLLALCVGSRCVACLPDTIVCLEIVGMAFCLRFTVLHGAYSIFLYHNKLAVSSSVHQCLFSGDVPDPKPWKRNYTTKRSTNYSQVPASFLQSDKARGNGNSIIIAFFFSLESPGDKPHSLFGAWAVQGSGQSSPTAIHSSRHADHHSSFPEI